MRNMIMTVLLVGCLAAPTGAFAQGAPADTPTTKGYIDWNDSQQLATVGAGIVVGALVLHLVVPGDLTYFAGGVVGGLIANWWYRNGGAEQVHALVNPTVLEKAKAADRRPAIAVRY